MKKTFATTLLGAALAGALLSSTVLAADKVDYAAVKSVKLAPLVTNAVPDAKVPEETQKAFDKRHKEVLQLLNSWKINEARPLVNGILKDFAAYPGLVRKMRGEFGYWLSHAKG